MLLPYILCYHVITLFKCDNGNYNKRNLENKNNNYTTLKLKKIISVRFYIAFIKPERNDYWLLST